MFVFALNEDKEHVSWKRHLNWTFKSQLTSTLLSPKAQTCGFSSWIFRATGAF